MLNKKSEFVTLFKLVLLVLAGPVGWAGAAAGAGNGEASQALTATILQLDKEAFSAFNQCAAPGQLEKHASYFAPDVEFYHDNGGVTWSREAMIKNTQAYVCGNFSRELIAGSARVYPIKDFGAIETGSHRFCQFASGKCEGLADFTIVWRLQDQQWKITRVLSYGHRASE